MSIRSVVTGGFSNGVFTESISLLPTLGYSIGEVILPSPMLLVAMGSYTPGGATFDAHQFGPGTYTHHTFGMVEADA